MAIVSEIVEQIEESGLTQAAIAEKAGVSRVQINRIVNRKVTRVHAGTLKKIQRAIRESSVKSDSKVPMESVGRSHAVANPNFEPVESEYRKWVQNHFGTKSFVGLGLPGTAPQMLTTIYVPALTTIDYANGSECEDDLDAAVARDSYHSTRQRADDEQIELINVDQRIQSTPRLVLLGCPGAGKTTALQHAALKIAGGDWFNNKCLPLYVRLPEYAAARSLSPDVDIIQWVASQISLSEDRRNRAAENDSESVGYLEMLRDFAGREDRTLIFLLDGLDEVLSEPEQRKLIQACERFVTRYPKNRFCVSSRPVGFDSDVWQSANFQIARMVEFGDEQISSAIEIWSKAQPLRDGESAEKIASEICENSRVKQIAANPMVLRILYDMRVCRGYSLPRRRVDLYEKVAEVFLELWESSKSHKDHFSETYSIDLDCRELCWLMSDLALEMQRRELVFAKRWWIEERMAATMIHRLGFDREVARDATCRILRFVSERTGLFEERALDLFAFSHRTLQEFFAAKALIDEADLPDGKAIHEILSPYRYHPDWTEVVRLVASSVTPARSERILRMILDDTDPTGRFLYRGQILALDCLLDGTTLADRELAVELFSSLKGLGKSHWLGITLKALQRLKRFDDLRNSELAKQTINQILSDAREELDDQENENLLACVHGLELKNVRGVADVEQESSAVLIADLANDLVSREIPFPNVELYSEKQSQWLDHARKLLEDDSVSLKVKRTAVLHAGVHAKLHPKMQAFVRKLLKKHPEEEIRGDAATFLSQFLEHDGERTRSLLLESLQNDQSVYVQSKVVSALRPIVPNDVELQETFSEIAKGALTKKELGRLERSAILALSESAVHQSHLRDWLIDGARKSVTPKIKAVFTLALSVSLIQQKDLVTEFRLWLKDNDARARSAAQSLADVFADDSLPWNDDAVDEVLDALVRIGLPETAMGNPCPHALFAIESLLDARQRRGGFQVEQVVSKHLSKWNDVIELGFIFGSVSRSDQGESSDVDVLLIGNISLKQLQPHLKTMERLLGREVNVCPYSLDDLREKLSNSDSFLNEVFEGRKIPLEVGRTPKDIEGLNHELGRLASQCMAGQGKTESGRDRAVV